MTYQIITINRDASLWVAVDPIDYQWAIEFLWNYKQVDTFFTTHYYAKRNIGPERTPVYLHVEIMNRVCPFDPAKPLVDHISGNTLDCRRENLRRVTPKVNSNNRYGKTFLLPIVQLELEPVPW